MSLQVKNYTTRAYWPRNDAGSVQAIGQTLDVIYSVWRQTDEALAGATIPPEEERFTLVYFHSSQLTKEVWNYHIELAFAEFGPRLSSAVTIDAVFHGDSAVVNKDKVSFLVSWEDIGRDGACVIRDAITRGEINAASPVIAVGHSMGGTNAMFLAAHDPALVDAIVLYDPVYGFGEISPPVPDEMILAAAQRMGSLSGAVYKNARDQFASVDEYKQFMDKKFVSKTFHPKIHEAVVKNMAFVNSDGTVTMKTNRQQQAASYLSFILTFDSSGSILKYITTPALVVAGDIADWNPEGSNELLSGEILQKASLTQVPGGGHNIVFQKPHECFNAVKQFISDQVTRAIAERRASKARLNSGKPQSQVYEELIANFKAQKLVYRKSKI